MRGDTCTLAACHRKRPRGCYCEPSLLNADGYTTRSGSPEGAYRPSATGQAHDRSTCSQARPFMSAF
eukprot:6722461-Prorocentrum_lima.AAC.1